MTGGVLSMTKISLSISPLNASCGVLESASETVMRSRYSPSAKAVESKLKWRSRNLSFSSFQSVSFAPRISTLYSRSSPFSSEAFQRPPKGPFAKDMDEPPESESPEVNEVFLRPIGGSERDDGKAAGFRLTTGGADL